MDKLRFLFLHKRKCPICGSKSKVKWYTKHDDVVKHKWYYIRCSNPDCFVRLSYPSGTLRGAIHDWNHQIKRMKKLIKRRGLESVRKNG